MIRRLGSLIWLAAALLGCTTSPAPPGNPPSPTASDGATSGAAGSAPAISPKFPGYLRVEVTADNRVLVEETQMSVAAFAAVLNSMAGSPPIILYHRANPSADPPPIFEDVLNAIISHRLTVQLVAEDFTAPGYVPPPKP